MDIMRMAREDILTTLFAIAWSRALNKTADASTEGAW